jgi:hypothetical protein
VGGELDRIDVDECAGLAREGRKGGDIVDGAGEVAGVAQRHEFGARGEEGGEGFGFDAPGFAVEGEGADGAAGFRGHGEPGGDVAVVIHGGDDDFVAGGEGAADGAGEGEGEGGHAGTDDYFAPVGGAEQGGGIAVGALDDVAGGDGGGEVAAEVGVGVEQAVCGCLGDGGGDLGAGGVVEMREGAGEGREGGAHCVDGKFGHGVIRGLGGGWRMGKWGGEEGWGGVGAGRRSFLKKRTKRLLRVLSRTLPAAPGSELAKVFCFFSSEKKTLPFLRRQMNVAFRISAAAPKIKHGAG